MSQDSSYGSRFLVEAREHLAVMNTSIIALERSQTGPEESIGSLLRAAHSLKGGAGFSGRRNIERLAHALEGALEHVRDGAIPTTPETIDVFLHVLDRITAMIDDLDHSEQVDITDALARLNAITSPITDRSAAPPADVGTELVSIVPQDKLDAAEFGSIIRTIAAPAGEFVYGVKLDWFECERSLGLGPAEVATRLTRAGKVIESETRVTGPPLANGLPHSPAWLLAAVSSPAGLEAFEGLLDIACARIIQLRGHHASTVTAEKQPQKPRTSQSTSSLRISVSLIDRMMALAGELVLVRNQAIRSGNEPVISLQPLLRRLDAVTNELQDAALRMRTQPVGTLFDRFPRMVRDLARQLGKQIDIEISGSEVELDKTILEMLMDPMTHLIRNCCDHGIELPHQRAASGKAPAGQILLSARQDRGQIVIEVRDDGKGIDLDALKRKAVERGIRRPDELEAMTPRQVYDLILLSGFSTAASVTDVSGRGVGMDVVKSNLDQIGGVIEISSESGKGSVFTMRLPLTLAIMPCLLLSSDGQSFALPQRDVEEILLLNGSAHRSIEREHDGEVVRWRGRLLPVARLDEALRHTTPFDAAVRAEIAARRNGAAAKYAAVIRLGSRRFVLAFDEVLQSENIVVKPLPALLRPLGIYAATTILGDGGVSLILNSEGIARHCDVLGRAAIEQAPQLPAPPEMHEARHIMLFRAGPDELLGLPMESVRRVVMIDPTRMEHIGERELINVDGAAINVLRLNHFLNLSEISGDQLLFLIFPRGTHLPVGILASEITDTPLLRLQLDSLAYQADGIAGSFMVHNDIALLLDLDRLLKMWDARQHAALPTPRAKRVLLVEDTAFFQKLIADHLRSDGYDVVVAVNGSDGLEKLRAASFDAVVSDLEMPVMDGLTLARRVREDQALAHIPMMALTTLNTPESRANAAACGFDIYEVKLEKDSLLAAVRRLLSGAKAPGGTSHG